MPDFATPGGAEATDFARAVGREVVVEDELLGLGAAGNGVEILRILGGAEGNGGEVLGFATVEDRRSVQTRKDAHLRGERADLMLGATIDALATLQEVGANSFDLKRIEEVDELDVVNHPVPILVLTVLLLAGGEQLFADRLHGVLAGELVVDEERVGKFGSAKLADEAHLLGILGLVGDFLVGKPQRTAHLNLKIDDLLDFLVGALHRGKEVRLGDFRSGAFHHEELTAETGVEEVKIGLLALFVGGVDNPFAIDAPNAHAPDRPHEGDVGDVKRGRGGVDGKDVALMLAIAADEHGVDLDVVVIAVGEEGADRAVAHTRREDFLLGGASFALEETSGEATGGVELLAVFALQREEVDAFAGLVGAGYGGEDRGVAHGYDDGSCRLFREKTGFNRELLSGDLGGELLTVLHVVS